MSKVDERLAEMKKHIDTIQAPDDLEQRLLNALAQKKMPRRRRSAWRLQVASLLLVAMLFGYHFNTLAYYGRTFLGYERVVDGAIQNLNELGKGQVLDLTHTFPDGRSITLEGIMLDGNQLVAFCRIFSPAGDLENHNIQVGPFMRGTVGRYLMRSGAGVISDDGTEMNYVFHFEPPRPWEKTMVIPFSSQDGSLLHEGEFRFVLDRQKAMGYILRLSVGKHFDMDTGKMTIHSLDASPTRTQVRGTLQGPAWLIRDTLTDKRFYPHRLDLKLLVNGEEWPMQGGSMSTDLRGITFQMDYDALPDTVVSIRLLLESFQTEHELEETVPLQVGQESQDIQVLGERIRIRQVRTDGASTYITVTSPESLVLTRATLSVDGHTAYLRRTVDEELEKLETGEILRTRTLQYEASGEELTLNIERVLEDTAYGVTMSLPLE